MENEQKNKRIQDALSNITKVLETMRDLYPDIPKGQIEIKNTKYAKDPLKILKRIDGIIKGFNEENAERKFNSVMAFLRITIQKEGSKATPKELH